MAEALARSLAGTGVESYSAGAVPRPVHPLAVKTMSEVGIDISHQRSKPLDGFLDQSFDFVISLCDKARESCPTLPTAREHIHWKLDDPSEVQGAEAVRLKAFRRVRDELRNRISLFLLANRVVRGASR
jgi:arsenate reductase